MSGRAWMCSVCTQLPAVSFCCCGATETFLCPLCYSGHISKFPTRFHMNLSIACYGNHRNPGFLEQLQARAAALPTRTLTLQQNLSTIDECIQALNLRTREFIDSLTSEAQEITKELQALRSKLEGEISAAVTEAEATMMQSDAPDISVLGKLLRDCFIPVERLTLFSYALEREPVSLLRKSLKFELSEPRLPEIYIQSKLRVIWRCLCGSANQNLQTKCVGCGRDKQILVPPSNSPPPKVLLWTCAVCSYQFNNVQNNDCEKCHQPRFKKAEHEAPFMQPGLWKCECGFANAQSAQVCEQCRKHRFQPAAELCRFDKNFRLDICSKCEKPRQVLEPPPPPVVKQAPAANAPNQHPPNWDQMNRKEKKAWKKKYKK